MPASGANQAQPETIVATTKTAQARAARGDAAGSRSLGGRRRVAISRARDIKPSYCPRVGAGATRSFCSPQGAGSAGRWLR